MNKLLFCLRALRSNLRTAPLAFVALVWSVAITFAFEAWNMRLVYMRMVKVDDYMIMVYLSILTCGVHFLFLLFMYNYWLKITDRRNIPYERMGAPRYVLFIESMLEMLLIVAVGCVLGLVADSVLNALAPRPKCLRYLDSVLFFKTAGIILIAPAALFLGRYVYSAIMRARRGKRKQRAKL